MSNERPAEKIDDALEAGWKKVLDHAIEGINRFAAEMAEKGIHVGVGYGGGKVVCPVDGEDWPCKEAR